MAWDGTYTGPISLDPRLFKALGPRPSDATKELARIQKLDLTGYSEEDVRANIIDPIVRLFGYDKGTAFSVDRGKSIEILNNKIFPDYKFNLWQEDFWIIEAKKPRRKKFTHKDLLQAVQYAAHPAINAALLVLCDGNKFDVYDREYSLDAPILSISRQHLSRDFDKLRLLLEPWQIWFFQKRRIIRLIDKIFDKEFNLERVGEFRSLINDRLNGKRMKVLDNFRSQIDIDDDFRNLKKYLAEASMEEIVDVHFFHNYSVGATLDMINNLVSRCHPSSFHVMNQMFPDRPRDANDNFFCHALLFLIELCKIRPHVNWIPSFLSERQGLEHDTGGAVRRLIALCLSHFANDESRKTISLFSAAIRRVFKILLIVRPEMWERGETLHLIERYAAPEQSWRQIVSSPARQMLLELDKLQILSTAHFVRQFQNENGEFLPNMARQRLKHIWDMEKMLLSQTENYAALVKERDLGEVHPTSWIDVDYDFLGHSCLCAINESEEWKRYTLEHHRSDIELIAALGSFQARKWLGIDEGQDIPPPSDSIIAGRFFFGDTEILKQLRAGYGRAPR